MSESYLNYSKLKLFIVSVSIAVLFFACHSASNSSVGTLCFVRLDSLKQSLDTAAIEMESFGVEDSLEVRDTAVKRGEGSVFHFDSDGKLGLYAYMINWPVSNFIILYDSLGRKQRLQEREVVQWRYRHLTPDSIGIDIFLCAVDRDYGGLVLWTDSYCDSNITLFKTSYSKIIGFSSKIPIEKGSDSVKVFLKGEAREKCDLKFFPFVDSMTFERR